MKNLTTLRTLIPGFLKVGGPFLAVFGIAVACLACLAAIPALVMWCWNEFMVPVFGFHPIGFGGAVALLVLVTLVVCGIVAVRETASE